MRKILAIILAITCLLLCGCQAGQEATVTEPPVQQTEPPTEPPTEAPTEPKPDWLHSGICSDGSFSEGALFIGDSLTAGLFSGYLESRGLTDDAWVMAVPGANPTAYFSGPKMGTDPDFYCYYSGCFHDLRMHKGVEMVGDGVTALYFMMGTNFLDSITEQTYIEILDHMLEHCPNATIYLQLVPFADSPLVDQEQINWRIWTAYYHYQELGEERVKIVNTLEGIGINLQSDGIHLTEEGYRMWYETLLAYAEENDIPQ